MSQVTVIKDEITSSYKVSKKMTLEEYLLYVPDDDFLYELDKLASESTIYTGGINPVFIQNVGGIRGSSCVLHREYFYV